MSKTIAEHALALHILTTLRDRNCGTLAFRTALDQIATLLAVQATADLPLDSKKNTSRIALFPVLRYSYFKIGNPIKVFNNQVLSALSTGAPNTYDRY